MVLNRYNQRGLGRKFHALWIPKTEILLTSNFFIKCMPEKYCVDCVTIITITSVDVVLCIVALL